MKMIHPTKWIFVMLLLCAYSSTAQLNINHYMRVGQTRISIGNYVGAIEYFNIVIKFKPHMPEPYFFRGIAKHRLEDFQGAVLDYNKAIEIKPYYPDAYLNRAMAYHELNDFANAIRDYEKALELDPKNEGIYNNLGIAKMAQKDVDGAIEMYNKALEVNPSSTYALMNRSNAKIVKGDVKGAIKDLNQVIIIRPHHAGAYLNRGLARFELNDYASAIRDYDMCIRLDPSNAQAYNNRGIIKQKLEDLNGAIMDYDMAIKLDPSMANSYFNRALAREALGRPGFESDYQIAADLNPRYDLSRFAMNSEQMAQQPGQQKAQPPAGGSQPPAGNLNPPGSSGEEENTEKIKEEEIRRRRRLNLLVSDNRNIDQLNPGKEDEIPVQNRNVIIDLQPVFAISAFYKNSINYERLQYYNAEIELLNKENNYNPILTITNKPNGDNLEFYQNLILFFNEKISISENSHNYLNRGIFYCITGNYNQSIRDFNRALQLDSTRALAYLSRGTCRLKMTEHILKLPEHPGQMNIPAGSERTLETEETDKVLMLEDYNIILEDYNKAISLQPGLLFGYFNRACIYLKIKKFDLAIADLDKAIELEPEFAEAYYNRGLTRILMDDTASGALDLSKAGELGLVEAYSIIKRYCN